MTLRPLFAVSGATGVGKTTSTARLPELVPDVIRLDGDLLWSQEYFDQPESTTRFYGTWLNMAAAIAENGRSLIFCGVVMPSSWEELAERERVGEIHYLALVCDPDVHEQRLRGRGPGSQDHRFPNFLNHNEWLRANASTTEPPMTVIDTTLQTPEETTEAVAAWIRERL
jgi:predicted kinase